MMAKRVRRKRRLAGPGRLLALPGSRQPVGLPISHHNRTHDRTRMPKSKAAPARTGRSSPAGSAEIDAMVARTAPSMLALLRDGVPRSKSTIIAALADRHPKEDVIRTLMRLAVTGQLSERERKYSLASAAEAETGVQSPDIDPESGG